MPTRHTLNKSTSLLTATLLTLTLGALHLELTGSFILFSIGSLILSAIFVSYAAYSIWCGRIRIGPFLLSQILLWHIAPWSYFPLIDKSHFIILNAELEHYIDASLAALLVCSLAAIPFLFWRPFVKIDYEAIAQSETALIFAVSIFSVVQAFLILSGSWGYVTVTGIDEQNRLSDSLQLMKTASYVIPIIASTLLASQGRITIHKKKEILITLILIAVLAIQILWFSVVSRRTLFMLFFFSYVAYLRNTFPKGIPPKKTLNILIKTVLIASLAALISIQYLKIRIATDLNAFNTNLTLLNILETNEIVENHGTDLASSFALRPFGLIESLAVLQQTSKDYLYGWNFFSQALLTIPSAIYPDKISSIGPTLETLWNSSIGVPYNDWANTLITESYVDFGFYGLIPYTLALTIVLHTLSRALGKIGGRTFSTIYAIIISLTLLLVETTIVGYMDTIRSLLVFSIIMLIFRMTLAAASKGLHRNPAVESQRPAPTSSFPDETT